MRARIGIGAAAVLAVSAMVMAAELKSGLEPGKAIGAFDVVKIAGAANDGVKEGAQLCYRCKYGARPMVMVFTRDAAAVAKLTKELDAAVAKNADKQLKAFVNVMAADREAAEAAAKKFAAEAKPDQVPVVVPVEFDNGPGDYGINPEATVTVIVASGSKVTANFAFGKGELNDAGVKKVLESVGKIVN